MAMSSEAEPPEVNPYRAFSRVPPGAGMGRRRVGGGGSVTPLRGGRGRGGAPLLPTCEKKSGEGGLKDPPPPPSRFWTPSHTSLPSPEFEAHFKLLAEHRPPPPAPETGLGVSQTGRLLTNAKEY